MNELLFRFFAAYAGWVVFVAVNGIASGLGALTALLVWKYWNKPCAAAPAYDPDAVYCGSCRRAIESNPVSVEVTDSGAFMRFDCEHCGAHVRIADR
jgi:hypothetical protein